MYQELIACRIGAQFASQIVMSDAGPQARRPRTTMDRGIEKKGWWHCRAASSARRWRLTWRAGQCLTDACPRRRRVCPDRERRLREFGVIQCSRSQDCQVRPRLRLARYGRSAALAELPVHAVAAVHDTGIIAQRSSHRDCGGRKHNIYGCAPGRKVLTVAAPTNS